jgi:hypothetical protein
MYLLDKINRKKTEKIKLFDSIISGSISGICLFFIKKKHMQILFKKKKKKK